MRTSASTSAALAGPRSALGVALAAALLAGGCGGAAPHVAADAPAPPRRRPAESRDPRWAVPVERPGLPNFHKVSDELYRGAQPKARGIRELKEMGVRTIVNLRLLHSDRDEIEEAGLTTDDIGYERIKMEAWDADDDEVVRFLRIVSDPARLPVFVHCKHGADRTGTMCAVYRIVVQGWTKEDAVEEMREGGFGFHAIWRGLPKYLLRMDVEEMKREMAKVVEEETR